MSFPCRLLLLVCLTPLAACGPNREDLENALRHRCDMERMEREMQEQPDSPELRAQYAESAEYLRIVVDGASDPDVLREALQDTPCG